MTGTANRSTRAMTNDVVDGLLALSRTLVAIVARPLAQLDDELTLGQYRVLVVLVSEGPQRASDLAQHLDVTPSTISRMCDRLYRKHLIRRYRRSDDRRASWTALTPAGRDLIGELMRQRRTTLTRLARAIPTTQRDCMAAGLRAVVDAAGEVPEPEWWKQWRAAADPDPLTTDG